MKTLDDFKKEKPESWKNFGPANRITAVLYFHEIKEGLSQEQIRERIMELEQGELEKGLAFLEEYKEIKVIQKGERLRYILPKRVRETFRSLYQI